MFTPLMINGVWKYPSLTATIFWLNENIGTRGEDWNWESRHNDDGLTTGVEIYHASTEDMVLFRLMFG